MDDHTAVMVHVHARHETGEEISDECARVIASWWYEGMGAGYAFVSTGAITTTPTDLWRRLCADSYDSMSADDKLCADMLGTYLLNRDERGPVEGWSGLWVR